MRVGGRQPVAIVGVINVSPESFYPGSVAQSARQLRILACRMVADGAAMIDLGALSTAPYKRGWVAEPEERQRLLAAVQVLRGVVAVPLAVDTQRASVAEAALAAGAAIVNDVSGLAADPGMAGVARYAAGVILMANETVPSKRPVIVEVVRLLNAALRRAAAAGIRPRHIVLDPGIGFFRHARLPWERFDCAVLRNLGELLPLGHPLLVGVSRKSFLGHLAGRESVDERLPASLAATAIAVMNGAALIRTHDVGPTRDAVRIAEAIRNERGGI